MGDGFPGIACWRLVFSAVHAGVWCAGDPALRQFAFVALKLMQLAMLVAFLPGVAHLEEAKPLDRGKARCANEVKQTSCLFVARHEHLAAPFDVDRSHGCGGLCVSL